MEQQLRQEKQISSRHKRRKISSRIVILASLVIAIIAVSFAIKIRNHPKPVVKKTKSINKEQRYSSNPMLRFTDDAQAVLDDSSASPAQKVKAELVFINRYINSNDYEGAAKLTEKVRKSWPTASANDIVFLYSAYGIYNVMSDNTKAQSYARLIKVQLDKGQTLPNGTSDTTKARIYELAQ